MLRRLAVLLLVLALFAIIGFVLVKLTERAGLMPDLGELATDLEIDMAATGVELSHGDQGKLIWRLRAEAASYDQEKSLVLVEAPTIAYFPQMENDALRVSAPRGSVDQRTSVVTLWPNVAAAYKNTSLAADQIVYDGKGLLKAMGNAVVRQEGVTLTAPVMSYDLDKRLFVASGGVIIESGTGKNFSEPSKKNAP